MVASADNMLEKETIVNLHEDGTIAIQTYYEIENIDTLISSDAINSPEKLQNIVVKINDIAIPNESFSEYRQLTDSNDIFRFVGVEGNLSKYASIGKKNKVYIKYEIGIDRNQTIPLAILEVKQRTYPKTNIHYQIVVKSSDLNYVPSAGVYANNYTVKAYRNNLLTFNNYYISDAIYNDISHNLFGFYFKKNTNVTQEHTKYFEIIESDFIRESVTFKRKADNTKSNKYSILYRWPENVTLSKHPVVDLEINGEKVSLVSFERGYFEDIIKTANFTYPGYYVGDGTGYPKNEIYIYYYQDKDSLAKITIDLEYVSVDMIQKKDDFNYIFKTKWSSPRAISNTNEYLSFKAPTGFHIDSTNHEKNLINKNLENVQTLSFHFTDESDYVREENLEIKYSRNEVGFLNILRYINVFSLVLFLLIVLFKRELIHYISWLSGLYFIVNISINKISTDYFVASFFYTLSFIPLILIIVSLLIKCHKKIMAYTKG